MADDVAKIPADGAVLEGRLVVPDGSGALVREVLRIVKEIIA